MFARKKHRWKVGLQASDGQVGHIEVEAYWNPDHSRTHEAIGEAGAAEAFMKAGKTKEFHPVLIERIPDEEPVAA